MDEGRYLSSRQHVRPENGCKNVAAGKEADIHVESSATHWFGEGVVFQTLLLSYLHASTSAPKKVGQGPLEARIQTYTMSLHQTIGSWRISFH